MTSALAAAAALRRDGAPSWEELVALAWAELRALDRLRSGCSAVRGAIAWWPSRETRRRAAKAHFRHRVGTDT